MWEVMAFGERPYWDMSNHEVSLQIALFSEVYSKDIFRNVNTDLKKPTSKRRSNESPDKPLAGDEGYQRGVQAAGADGLPLSCLPADAAVLAPGPLQEAALWGHRQPAGQAAAEPGLTEDHRRLRPTVRFIYIPD